MGFGRVILVLVLSSLILAGCVEEKKEVKPTPTITPIPTTTTPITTPTPTPAIKPQIKSYNCQAVDTEDADKNKDTVRVNAEVITDRPVTLYFKLIDPDTEEIIIQCVKEADKRGKYSADLTLSPEYQAKTYRVEIELVEDGKTLDSVVQEVFLYPLGYGVAKLEVETTFYTPYPLAFYNAFYHQGFPDIEFTITNTGDYPTAVRVSAEYQGYSERAIKTETVMPGETKTISLTIPLIREKIEQIKTKTKFTLHYKVEYEENGEWKVYDEGTEMIDVYPMDTMIWWMKDNDGNWQPMHEYIAVFVTPKSDAVQELLAVAKEFATDDYGPYSDYGLYRCLPGYQYDGEDIEGWAIYTALQVKAIYNALKYYYEVSYVNMPTAFATKDEIAQRISLPEESLYLSSANCIDGAVLFASALEAIGINPIIVIVPGHAFVAWEIKQDSGIITALETTMIADSDFEDAWDVGDKELKKYWDVLQDGNYENGELIDIKECREMGILPMK